MGWLDTLHRLTGGGLPKVVQDEHGFRIRCGGSTYSASSIQQLEHELRGRVEQLRAETATAEMDALRAQVTLGARPASGPTHVSRRLSAAQRALAAVQAERAKGAGWG
ncbi:MAG: hypothetical protein WEB00_06615 [Dehalococcoidia bacterium]